MINFEYDSQIRPGAHNSETEQQVNQLWNSMITPPETARVIRSQGFDDTAIGTSEDDYTAMVQANVLKNIRPVHERSAHTVALYEKMLRAHIAADFDFEDIQPDSDDARNRVYEGILATEKRHRNLRPSDFTDRDSQILREATREYSAKLADSESHETMDLSETGSLTSEQSKLVADAITLGVDPSDRADELLFGRQRIG